MIIALLASRSSANQEVATAGYFGLGVLTLGLLYVWAWRVRNVKPDTEIGYWVRLSLLTSVVLTAPLFLFGLGALLASLVKAVA